MKEKRKITITYKDEHDKEKIAVKSVDSKYDDVDSSIPYRERVEDSVCEMAEGGGFWINSNKIIPYHRVLCIETVPIKKASDGQQPDVTDKPEKPEKPEKTEDNKDQIVNQVPVSPASTPQQPSKKKVNHRRTHRKNLKAKSKKS